MVLDTLFSLLEPVPYGFCAVSLDQNIVFWNRTAERIPVFSSHEFRGRRCDDVMRDARSGSLTPECVAGCSSIRYVRAGLIPPPTRVRLLCSSGEHKWVPVTPAAISGVLKGAPLLVYFFEDGEEVEGSGSANDSTRDALAEGGADVMLDHPEAYLAPGEKSALSRRDLEVLRLVALGLEAKRTAVYLGIGCHTVRNNLRNLRDKLGASTKLDAVVKGLRLGIISVGGSPQ